MKQSSPLAGFTLLEVLVALAILSTAMYSGFYLLNRTISNAGIVEEKVIANWVAKNALAQVELAGRELEEFDLVDEPVAMYGKEFLVNVSTELQDETRSDEVTQTKLSIRIQVAPADEPARLIEDLNLERLL